MNYNNKKIIDYDMISYDEYSNNLSNLKDYECNYYLEHGLVEILKYN